MLETQCLESVIDIDFKLRERVEKMTSIVYLWLLNDWQWSHFWSMQHPPQVTALVTSEIDLFRVTCDFLVIFNAMQYPFSKLIHFSCNPACPFHAKTTKNCHLGHHKLFFESYTLMFLLRWGWLIWSITYLLWLCHHFLKNFLQKFAYKLFRWLCGNVGFNRWGPSAIHPTIHLLYFLSFSKISGHGYDNSAVKCLNI